MAKYPSQMQDKFNLRFPDGMRDAVAERAKENGRSMNSEIVQMIQDCLDRKTPETQPTVSLSNELMDKIIALAESIEEMKDKQNQLDNQK
ncbi:Arc-like DNA binding domain protein [Photorhabdus australis subsp. thailandensis]|uniref:Arc-like DNA binding domain protein n=1 Tax=Photorhabdus australis subsp. thailandensis TaxID=2805096 RepID=A0A1C0U6M7_9GAMM|nr:Arc family DNA-binding protein [Photorhabdus australis]OCQ53543.1 Arc-like DNA binding domain protein [Photorhabdus australis subsp. thailandensis]